MVGFKSHPLLEYIDGKSWVLKRDLEYINGDGVTLIVKAPFTHDFASVPRILWRLLPPTGYGRGSAYGSAAILHDACYRLGSLPAMLPDWPGHRAWKFFSRRQADALFYEAMKSLGVSWWRRWSMWAAVRCFGWGAWKKSAA